MDFQPIFQSHYLQLHLNKNIFHFPVTRTVRCNSSSALEPGNVEPENCRSIFQENGFRTWLPFKDNLRLIFFRRNWVRLCFVFYCNPGAPLLNQACLLEISNDSCVPFIIEVISIGAIPNTILRGTPLERHNKVSRC